MFDLKDKEGVWLKGNLHMHTGISDGKLSPKDAMKTYIDKGYDFLAVTDHWKYYKDKTYKNLTVISGIEYDIGNNPAFGVFHIVGLFLKKNPKYKSLGKTIAEGVQGAIDAIHAQGGIAVLAHPAWSLETPEQIAWIHGYDLVEIYNSVSDEPFVNRADSGNLLDSCMARGMQMPYLTAVDDCHFMGAEITRACIWLKAASNSHADIRAALERGDFYGSENGPEIVNLHREENKIKIEFKDTKTLYAFTDSITLRQKFEVEGKSEFEFDFSQNDANFVRFMLVNEKGGRSWTSYVCKNKKM